jgi:prevent-host-death family protein
MEVNIHQAKTHLSKLLQKVADGEEVIIARSGVPFARIVLMEPEKATLRPLGMDRGKIVVPDDFNAPLPDDVLAQFYGGELPRLERTPPRKRR